MSNGPGERADKPKQAPQVFNRFSDKVAVVSLGTLLSFGGYLVSTSWQLRGELEKLIEAERTKTTAQSTATRQYAEQRIQEYHRQVKDDLGDIKADIRDLRAQLIKLYGRGK